MNRTVRRTGATGALVIAGILALSSCVAPPDQQLLESGSAAEIPASMTPDQVEMVDADGIRFLGEDSDGHAFYIAPRRDPAAWGPGLCLLIDGIEDGPMLGCGTAPLEVGGAACARDSRCSPRKTKAESGSATTSSSSDSRAGGAHRESIDLRPRLEGDFGCWTLQTT